MTPLKQAFIVTGVVMAISSLIVLAVATKHQALTDAAAARPALAEPQPTPLPPTPVPVEVPSSNPEPADPGPRPMNCDTDSPLSQTLVDGRKLIVNIMPAKLADKHWSNARLSVTLEAMAPNGHDVEQVKWSGGEFKRVIEVDSGRPSENTWTWTQDGEDVPAAALTFSYLHPEEYELLLGKDITSGREPLMFAGSCEQRPASDSMPIYSLDDLWNMLGARHNERQMPVRVRVRFKASEVGNTFVWGDNHPRPFMMNTFKFVGLPQEQVDLIKEGDQVEVVGQYANHQDTSTDRMVSWSIVFRGTEVHKVQP